jgi:fatty-acyl-CoA synthase
MSGHLTFRPFLRRAAHLFPEKEVVSRTASDTTRYTYGDVGDRVRALAAGLSTLGVAPGDWVGTLGWNHRRHYEPYFAVPLMGAQVHTINVQLPDEDIAYIVNDASDDILLVDPSMVETVARLWDDLDSPEHVVVMEDVSEVPESAPELPTITNEDLLETGQITSYD